MAWKYKLHIQEIQGIRPHVSARPSDQSIQLGNLSRLDHNCRSRTEETTLRSSIENVGKFCVGTLRGIYLSREDLFSDSSLVLGSICLEFLISKDFCLSSRR
jgi:hypothetical protein